MTTPILPHERGLANNLKAERDARHYHGWHDENGKSLHPLFPDLPSGVTWEEYQAQREHEQREQDERDRPWREQRASWQTSEKERYLARIEQVYPIPKHWTNSRARARYYHLDLDEMDPTELRSELNALHRRVWLAKGANDPFTGVTLSFTEPGIDWLHEREQRLLAALRGELPLGACPRCGSWPPTSTRRSGNPATARKVVIVGGTS